MVTAKDRKRYSREYKLEAVKLCEESGKSVAEIARELDISVHQLRNWRFLAKKNKENAFPGSGRKDTVDELTRLRKEVKELRQERDILKKTAIYFAKEIPNDTDL
jgi:transposase